jgi:PAS domain S-box-containing protein
MKIRTQFIINMVVLGSILVFVSAAVIITNRWAEQTRQQQELAAQIEHEAYELGYLANDYLLYRESQQASRWESKFASFSDHLSGLEAGVPEKQLLLDNTRRNQQQLKAVFEEVKARIEAAPQTPESGFDEEFMQVFWGRLEVQNQGMIFNVSRLEGMLNEQEHGLEQMGRLLSFALIGTLGVFLLVNYGLTFRRILQAIAGLQAGTRIIGSGNLDFAIDVKSDDEIGELSHAFNRMTAQLRTITASRADLEREIAERKQAERAQQLERARWQGIVEGIADEVWTCDAQGKMSLLNLEAVTAMGLDIFKDKSVEEIYQEVEIFYPDGQLRPPEQAPLLHSLGGEIVRGEEIMRHRQTGITRYRQFSSAPTRDTNGTITGAVAIVRDVTDQKVAEEGLRRYELLSSHSRDIILFMGRDDGRLLEVNAAAIQTYGYSREELLALTIRDLRAPDTLGLTAEQMAQADTGGILFETVHRRKDGTTFPVEVSSRGATIDGMRTLVSVVRDISERKRTEQALLESEEKYRLLANHSNDWIYWIKPDRSFQYVAPSSERVTGYTPRDFTNDPGLFIHMIHPDDRQRVEPHLGEVQEGSETHDLDYRILTKSDEVRWISHSCEAVYSPDGRYIGRSGTNRDITDRKHAEEKLRRSEAMLRAILDQMPSAVTVRDAQTGALIISNARSQEIMGTLVDSADQFARYRGFHPDGRPYQAEDWPLSRSLASGEVVHAEEVTYQQNDGTRITLSINSAPVRDPQGQTALAVAVFDDVTQRKRADEQLERSRQRLNEFLTSIQDDFYVLDRDWNFVYASRLFTSKIGKEPEDFVGNNIWEMFPKHVGTAFEENFRAAMEKREVRRFEIGGKYTSAWYRMTAFPSNEGITVLGTDITDRKRAEEEIANLAKFPTENPNPILRVQTDGRLTYANTASQELLDKWACKFIGYLPEELRDFITIAAADNLNKTVDVPCNDKIYSIMIVPIVEGGYINIYGRDITDRKRAEESLKLLAEDLRRSNAELEQFAYVASHDLQEPLRMISSYVQLLARRYQGKLDNDADEFIHFAVDGAKRMQNLINDLLSYSRVGTRTNPLVPVSAENILKEALANLQFLIEENGAEITYQPLPVVRGDFPQLVTVFQNLVGNAIKFRGAEPPCIHIEARQAEEEWIFSVRDNGIGIDPKFAERIFVIFQRLNDRAAYPGTGIGLAICKRVIQRHGGRIWVESGPGEGATFYFTLPVKETL